MPYEIRLIKKPSGRRRSTCLSVFFALLSVLSDIGLPIRPALLVTRRKHCANALLCGAYPCRNPFASTEAEGFSAFGELYTIPGRRWAEIRHICTSSSNETRSEFCRSGPGSGRETTLRSGTAQRTAEPRPAFQGKPASHDHAPDVSRTYPRA